MSTLACAASPASAAVDPGPFAVSQSAGCVAAALFELADATQTMPALTIATPPPTTPIGTAGCQIPTGPDRFVTEVSAVGRSFE
jgi:hypothetical protein